LPRRSPAYAVGYGEAGSVLHWHAVRAGTEHFTLPPLGPWGIARGSRLALAAPVKNNQAGFAVIGSLIIATLTTVLLSVAQKVTAERRPVAKPAGAHLASVLAEQKLRELSAEAVTLSPDSALLENVSGFVEYLDKKGVLLGGGPTPKPQTAYIRRWSISAVPTNPDDQVVIRVLILPKGSRAPVHPVHLMMVKSRVAD
jgi:hypothetical protein